MNRSVSIILSISITIVFFALFTYSFLEIEKIRLFIISNLPDAKEISKLEALKFVLAIAALVVLILFILSFRLAKRKPQIVREYIETEKKEEQDVKIISDEENMKKQERIQNKTKHILEQVEHDNVEVLGETFLISLSKSYDIVQGIFYTKDKDSDTYSLKASYAYYTAEDNVRSFQYGHGLPGQVAMNKELLNLKNVPQKYLTIMSGLGNSSPKNLLIFPFIANGETVAVVELASFSFFDSEAEKIIRTCAESLSASYAKLSGINVDEISE